MDGGDRLIGDSMSLIREQETGQLGITSFLLRPPHCTALTPPFCLESTLSLTAGDDAGGQLGEEGGEGATDPMEALVPAASGSGTRMTVRFRVEGS